MGGRVARGRDRAARPCCRARPPRRPQARRGRTRRPHLPEGRRVAPVRSTSAGSPETWSACTCVSNTATIGDADRRGGARGRRPRGRRADRRRRAARACDSRTGSWRTSVASLRNGRRITRRLLLGQAEPRQGSPARRHSGKPTSSRRAGATAAQQTHGVVGVDAVRPAAIRDDLARRPAARRTSAASSSIGAETASGDVPRRVLGSRAHVEQHHAALRQPRGQVIHTDAARPRRGRRGSRRPAPRPRPRARRPRRAPPPTARPRRSLAGR